MATEKYVIEVKRKMVDDTGLETQASQKFNANTPTSSTASIDRASVIKNSVVFMQGMRVAKSVFNFATSNYGNITGDTVAQHRIDVALQITGEAINIASSFLVGGVVGGAAAIVGSGLNYANQLAQQTINTVNQNAQISQFRERIGNVISKGGRR